MQRQLEILCTWDDLRSGVTHLWLDEMAHGKKLLQVIPDGLKVKVLITTSLEEEISSAGALPSPATQISWWRKQMDKEVAHKEFIDLSHKICEDLKNCKTFGMTKEMKEDMDRFINLSKFLRNAPDSTIS